VPRFVLAELQNIADSEDALRRGRGRRGLEILNEMRLNDALKLDIIEEDPKDIKEVDHKLVYLAKKYKANILTTFLKNMIIKHEIFIQTSRSSYFSCYSNYLL
jgi:uncharacterized protein YacL